MTRRIKRTHDFEVTLELKNDDFIRPPREAQRNWLLNRAIKEFADDLQYLDEIAGEFIAGADTTSFDDRTCSKLSDLEIMEDWQIPVMEAMANIAAASGGEILEIGYGRGIASRLLQTHKIKSHTIIECNTQILATGRAWAQKYADQSIYFIEGLWQDVIEELGSFDGIFFHTYPLNEKEFAEHVAQSSTFAEHFFSTAGAHLKPGGHFTYLSNEYDSLSRAHQRALFNNFSSFALSRLEGLPVPENTRDAQWLDTLVIVKAVK